MVAYLANDRLVPKAMQKHTTFTRIMNVAYSHDDRLFTFRHRKVVSMKIIVSKIVKILY